MFTKWLVRLRALLRRAEVESEFDEELRFHLEREAERYVAGGMTPEAARRAARRDFGDPGRVREEARETWRWRWLDELLHDLRYARRGLVRSPGFTVVAALSLGFAIGATTTLFSVVDTLDLRSLPYRDGDRLVWLAEVRSSDDRRCPRCPLGTSLSTLAQWSAEARSYDGFAFWSTSSVYFRQGDVADNVTVGYASPGFFEFLGIVPLFGRDVAPDDTVSGAEPVVLLSHETWQSRFGGDRGVLGARFEFHGDPALTDARMATVVGVLPEGFRFGGDAAFWFALSAHDASGWVDAMARLKPGVGRAGAEAELRTIAARLAALDAERNQDRDVSILPLRERLGFAAGQGRLLLFGITTLVLLLAVMNVTGLSLARTMSRQAELTVRSSLGATRMRLVRQLVVEGVCLGSLGGAIGVLLAIWGARAASHWFRIDVSGLTLSVDHRVFAFGAGAAVLVGILTALLPSAAMARWNLESALGVRSSTLSPRIRQVTGALLVAQIASGLVLLTGAGVLSSEFLKLRFVDLGFDPENVYRVYLFGDRELRATPEAWRPTVEEARRRVAGVAGVATVAVRHESALAPEIIRPEGANDPAGDDVLSPRVEAVDASFFETFRTTILAGRGFVEADRRGDRPVCIIDAAAAAAFWPGELALGRQVFVGDSTGGEWLSVVGVAANIEEGDMAERHWPTIYRPFAQAPLYHPAASLYVRLAGPGGAGLAALQRAVREALGRPASAFQPLTGVLDLRFRTQRFNALALDVFAAFALLLAAMGIYGSVAYAVARRTREIGVRVALGAARSGVLRLVARHTMWLAAGGIALGLVGSFTLMRALRVFVSATSVANPWTFAASALLVGLVALLATYLPARRATAVDPLIALRTD